MYISDISQVYLRHISGISQTYLRYIHGISQIYLRNISGKHQVYLSHILGISVVVVAVVVVVVVVIPPVTGFADCLWRYSREDVWSWLTSFWLRFDFCLFHQIIPGPWFLKITNLYYSFNLYLISVSILRSLYVEILSHSLEIQLGSTGIFFPIYY